MATKKVAAKKPVKKATPIKPTVSVDINFEEDIPSIKRAGAGRTSKYVELLDGIKERAQSNSKSKVAVMTFETQSKATSRYLSLKTAVKSREDAPQWTVAARTVDGEPRVYIKYESASESAETENE